MMIRYFVLAAAVFSMMLIACGEPRRTPDGHLMDRPKTSAYGPDDITRHDAGASDAEDESAENIE